MANLPSDPSNQSAEEIKLQERANRLLNVTHNIKAKNAEAAIRGLKKERQAQLDLYLANKISSKSYDDIAMRIERNERALQRVHDESKVGSTSLVSGFKNAANQLGLTQKMSQKLGLSLQDLNAVGMAYWIFSVLDAQRVMNGFATATLRSFGSFTGAARNSAKETIAAFRREFGGEVGKEKVLNAMYFTDQERSQFVKSLFSTGVQLRNVTGSTLQNIQERLLALSGAFGISIDDMVGKLYTFGDVFRLSTGGAALEIERLTSLSLKLGVAPGKFLNMVTSLTSQFKLQRIQIAEVSQVYTGFYKKLNLGVESTTALTNTTISSLAALNEGRIAAYLSVTGGQTGTALTSKLMDFYKQPATSQSNLRLNLAEATLTTLANKFKQVSTNEFAKTRLVMQTFGIKDMETGTRLMQAVDSMNSTGAATNNAVDQARQILSETTGTEDKVMNLVTNAAFALIRFLGSVAGFLGGSAVKAMVGESLAPLESKMKELTTTTGQVANSTYTEITGQTSVLDGILIATTSSARFNEQAVQIAKAQVSAAMIGAEVAAASASTPGGAIAAKAAIEAGKKAGSKYGESMLAPYTSVIVSLDKDLVGLIKLQKTYETKAAAFNAPAQ